MTNRTKRSPVVLFVGVVVAALAGGTAVGLTGAVVTGALTVPWTTGVGLAEAALMPPRDVADAQVPQVPQVPKRTLSPSAIALLSALPQAILMTKGELRAILLDYEMDATPHHDATKFVCDTVITEDCADEAEVLRDAMIFMEANDALQAVNRRAQEARSEAAKARRAAAGGA